MKFFDGIVDEVTVHDKALSASEVMKIHKRPLVIRPELNVEIQLEERCAHCKGTNVNALTGASPCPECVDGYQPTFEGETLLQFVRLHRRHTLTETDALHEFVHGFGF